jgi:hypothetical protein
MKRKIVDGLHDTVVGVEVRPEVGNLKDKGGHAG